MLRKTLVTVVSVAALCVGSTAMAAHMGGGGGGGGGMMMNAGRAPTMGGGGGGMGGPAMHGGPMTAAPITRGPMTAAPMTRGPMTTGPIQGWNGRTAWGNNRFHNHFHNRFRNRFFAFGFGGPIYDYAGSCWSWVPTRSGWQWIYICGDYYGY